MKDVWDYLEAISCWLFLCVTNTKTIIPSALVDIYRAVLGLVNTVLSKRLAENLVA